MRKLIDLIACDALSPLYSLKIFHSCLAALVIMVLCIEHLVEDVVIAPINQHGDVSFFFIRARLQYLSHVHDWC